MPSIKNFVIDPAASVGENQALLSSNRVGVIFSYPFGSATDVNQGRNEVIVGFGVTQVRIQQTNNAEQVSAVGFFEPESVLNSIQGYSLSIQRMALRGAMLHEIGVAALGRDSFAAPFLRVRLADVTSLSSGTDVNIITCDGLILKDASIEVQSGRAVAENANYIFNKLYQEPSGKALAIRNNLVAAYPDRFKAYDTQAAYTVSNVV
jgi:hypothetical protein